jgi:hypothetical protein
MILLFLVLLLLQPAELERTHPRRAQQARTAVRSSLPSSVQEDFPALDRCRAQQPQRRPRIVREPGLDGWLTFGSNDEQELLLPVTQWAAQDDKSVVCEGVHKRSVLLSLLLLAHGDSRVPVLSPFAEDSVVDHWLLSHWHLLSKEPGSVCSRASYETSSRPWQRRRAVSFAKKILPEPRKIA